MARVSYLGLADPVTAFEGLWPYRKVLAEMQRLYHPNSPEYRAIHHATLTLDAAANLITGHLQFFDVGYGDTGHIGTGHRG